MEFRIRKSALRVAKDSRPHTVPIAGGGTVRAEKDSGGIVYFVEPPEPDGVGKREILLTPAGLIALNEGESLKCRSPFGVLTIVPPETSAPEPAQQPETKGIEEIMAATFDKPTPVVDKIQPLRYQSVETSYGDGGVRSSEFGLAPQVGKMLLDGLKAARRIKYGEAGSERLSDLLRAIDALIAEAEKPGFPVPPDEAETFANPDKLAEVVAGPPEAAYGRQLMLCLDNLRALRTTQPAGFQLVFGNGAKLVCKRRDFDAPITARIDLPETPWRLPTLAECAGDPEATRVWNAVHKPALEWHKTADGLPPITGEGDSRSESEHRAIWIYFADDREVRITKAYLLNRWIAEPNSVGVVPTHWMECDVKPAPPKEFPKTEITARVDSGLV